MNLKLLHNLLEILDLFLGVVAAAHVLLAPEGRGVLKPDAAVFAEEVWHLEGSRPYGSESIVLQWCC